MPDPLPEPTSAPDPEPRALPELEPELDPEAEAEAEAECVPESEPEAAATPSPAAPPMDRSGRRRAQVVIAVLLGLLSWAVVAQVRLAGVDASYAGLREQDLVDLLAGVADQSQRAESEIARLERTRDQLLSDTGRREAALAQAEQQADTLQILAGQVPVTGPGIRITIDDSAGAVDVETMVDLIQELRTAGAEAMSFNGSVRVVAQTAVDGTPGHLEVDGTRLKSPYAVDVIGEPGTLRGAVDFPSGPRKQLEDRGATVTVEQSGSVVIKAIAAPRKPEYAGPTPAQ
jgi:uncharacterized protein YlxW (UPF0749 family)